MKKLIPVLLVILLAVFIGGCEEEDTTPTTPDDVVYCTQCDEAFGAAIDNRLQTGFLKYNEGYEAWLVWCDELYDVNAMYNIYGQHFSLEQYKRLMGAMFQEFDITLGGEGATAGDIGTINTDYTTGITAIHYAVSFKKKKRFAKTQTIDTMEFVQFREDAEFGAKVMEGWALSSAQVSPSMKTIRMWMNEDIPFDVLREYAKSGYDESVLDEAGY